MPKNIKINLADCLGTSNKCGKVDEQRIWEFQRRLETLEAKPDNDNQLLSLTDNKLSITNGNEVTLPVYDDTNLTKKVEELENRPQGSNQTLTLDGNILSISDGNSVTLEKTDPYLRTDLNNLYYNIMPEAINKSYKDLKSYIDSKEDKDNQTLTLNGDTLSISNGNSVKVPQMVQWYPHIAWAEEVNPIKNFTTRTSVSAPQSTGFYANYVGFCYTTSQEDPQTPTSYRWTRVSQVTELEKQMKEVQDKLASIPTETPAYIPSTVFNGDSVGTRNGDTVTVTLGAYTLEDSATLPKEFSPVEVMKFPVYNTSGTVVGIVELTSRVNLTKLDGYNKDELITPSFTYIGAKI